MKDSLKDFVDKNRAAFDDKVTSGDLWSRISGFLPEIKERSLWNSVSVWRIAAGIFLASAVYFFTTRGISSAGVGKDQVSMQRDFSDLESFYRNEIAEKARLISDYDAVGESDQVTQDFQKLDAMYQVLSEELKSHPDAKVKDAMILNLLVRVDLLNQQLKRLEDSKRRKKSAKAAEV